MTPNRPPWRPMAPPSLPQDIRLSLPKNMTPRQASTLLQQAQDAYFKLLTGQLPSGVDTPQLGRVTFCATTPADLQRLIDYLQGVASGGGDGSNGYGNSGMNVRKPFSFYGWP